jgi:RIO kinase 1
MDRLQQLLDEGVLDAVYQQLKAGKEAEVWLVSHQGQPVAAKLYKAREHRNFKNNVGYLEGRQVRNTRTQRAMDRGTAFGRQAAEEAWKSAEADALYALHAAGVRVPKPVLFYEGVLLMEVIGDHEGRVAPRLVEAAIGPEQALPLYLELRAEVIKMLAIDSIHGDLSEFNILLGATGPVIIDFPQTVAAARNSRSEPFFKRDLGNLIRFFSSIDPAVAKYQSDIDEIWRAYVRRELTSDFVPSGRSSARGAEYRPPFSSRKRDQRRSPPNGPRQGFSNGRGPAPASSKNPTSSKANGSAGKGPEQKSFDARTRERPVPPRGSQPRGPEVSYRAPVGPQPARAVPGASHPSRRR